MNVLEALLATPEWHTRAACAGMAPDARIDPEADDVFFPADQRLTAEAYELCRGCEVREECFESALAAPFPIAGTWGGLGERVLDQARRRRQPSRRRCEHCQDWFTPRCKPDTRFCGDKCRSAASTRRARRAA